MKTIRTNRKLKMASIAAMSMGATSAIAAVPTEVTDAIETAGTDAVSVGTAVFVVIVGIFAIKLLRRAL